MEKNILSRALNSLPIKWGYYINKDKQKQKTIFVGHEKAIYDANGRQLDSKLIDIQDSVSDAFLETKAYSAGNYTIYLNRLYKFTTAKPAGPWDGSKVVPVSVAGELAQLYGKLDLYAALSNNYVDRAISYTKDNYTTWGNGIISMTVIIEGPKYYIFGYKNNQWGSVIILSYFIERPIYMRVNNGNWAHTRWI